MAIQSHHIRAAKRVRWYVSQVLRRQGRPFDASSLSVRLVHLRWTTQPQYDARVYLPAEGWRVFVVSLITAEAAASIRYDWSAAPLHELKPTQRQSPEERAHLQRESRFDAAFSRRPAR